MTLASFAQGWGGNHWTAGGAVRGGRIHGAFPASLSVEGSLSIGRSGRLIPTSPWEAIWHALAGWMGVDEERMAAVLPNKDNFAAAQLLSTADVFE